MGGLGLQKLVSVFDIRQCVNEDADPQEDGLWDPIIG